MENVVNKSQKNSEELAKAAQIDLQQALHAIIANFWVMDENQDGQLSRSAKNITGVRFGPGSAHPDYVYFGQLSSKIILSSHHHTTTASSHHHRV